MDQINASPKLERDDDLPEAMTEHAHNPQSSLDSDDLNKLSETPQQQEGDALDEGEILELQAFIPRRQWIEEKIQFLEQLPPVELFENLEYLQSASRDPIPGLPTREELAVWLQEHDAIEQEAERFDSNDMKRLKKFAKAATQRNLSPADTDLIEVTLTTLLGLDKLIHLLRARSETLDLIGLRLTWEEKRLGAWLERDAIKSEIAQFVEKSGRWSSEIYQQLIGSSESGVIQPGELPERSSHNPSIIPGRKNSGFSNVSRGARYKLAEDLTREVGRLNMRIAAWKRNFITPAGKAIDRMIEKKTVPDPILDEQDRIEDIVKPTEALSKFTMELVAQWKKADELYGELRKDQETASILRDEIAQALNTHPNARQDSAFKTRCQALSQRIAGFTSLAHPRLFPRPLNPSFPDQHTNNDSILTTLSFELNNAQALIKEVTATAAEYHKLFEDVKKAETLRDRLHRNTSKMEACEHRLLKGSDAEDGDGSPIDLEAVKCLDQLTHGAYLALLPLTSSDLDEAKRDGNSAASDCRTVMGKLSDRSLDPEFTRSVISALDSFEKAKARATTAKEGAASKATTLREVRKLWGNINGFSHQLDGIKVQLADMMERSKWHPIGQDTPVRTPMPHHMASWLEPASVSPRLEELSAHIPSSLVNDFVRIKPSIGDSVAQALENCTDNLTQYLGNVRGMGKLHDVVQKQASIMGDIRQEEAALTDKIDTLSHQLEETRDAVLLKSDTAERIELLQTCNVLEKNNEEIKENVSQFIDGLMSRIPFIGRPDQYFPGPLRSFRLSLATSPPLGGTDLIDRSATFAVPLDVASLDHTVRSDANNLTIHLSGKLQELSRNADFLRLATSTRQVDDVLDSLLDKIKSLEQNISEEETRLGSWNEEEPSTTIDDIRSGQLKASQENVEAFASDYRNLALKSVPQARDAVQELLGKPGAQDEQMQEGVLIPRLKREKEIETQVDGVATKLEAVTQTIISALATEKERLDRLRKEEEEKARQEEEERFRLEEEERLRLEAEESAHREQQALEELERQKREASEKERIQLEEEERLQQEREQQQKHLEDERILRETQQREQEEQERAQRLESEQARLDAIAKEEERLKLLADQLEEDQKRFKQEQEQATIVTSPTTDVFSVQAENGADSREMEHSEEALQLLTEISENRARLRSLSLRDWVRPALGSVYASNLPSPSQVAHMHSVFAEVEAFVDEHSDTTFDNVDVETAFRSLKFELDASKAYIDRCQEFAWMSEKIADCDGALSDLLEHIDSFPAAPLGELQSTHISDPKLPPERQLSERVSFAEKLLKDLDAMISALPEDDRVTSERERLEETWKELQEMAVDRLDGKSRPSTASESGPPSGRTSSLSAGSISSGPSSKNRVKILSKKPRGNLSIGSRPSTLAPPESSKRTSSAAVPKRKDKSENRLSLRSVSGPIVSPNSTLHKPTFASRQRTNSSSVNDINIVVTPTKRTMHVPPQSLTWTPQSRGALSPTFSDASAVSSRSGTQPRQRNNSSYSRVNRLSFSKSPRTPVARPVRKPYVANPKNKLDVAVGKVVNNLSVHVPIQPVSAPGWEDQSGKYWIGDEEPKLCFCRILRSNMVMVRVGGGWCELSKFLRDHFAHLAQQIPEAPLIGSKEQKWISSATLKEGAEEVTGSPKPSASTLPPRTPEPKNRTSTISPAILVNTPGGTSPRSLHSTGSPGSPLTPLQFLRRAEQSPLKRPGTPPLGMRPFKGVNRTPSATIPRIPSTTIPQTPAKTPTAPHWRT